jgi:hypothetical protein
MTQTWIRTTQYSKHRRKQTSDSSTQQPHTRGSDTTDVTKTPKTKGYNGRTIGNKTRDPARTRKVATNRPNKTVSNIIYTITKDTYIPSKSSNIAHHIHYRKPRATKK